MKKSLVFTLCLVLIMAGCGSEDPAPKSIDPSVEASRDAAAAARVDAIIEEHTVKKRPTYTEEEIETALGGLRKYTDEFKPGSATYMSSVDVAPYKKYEKAKTSADLRLYINIDADGHAYPCASMEYKGESWIFFDDLLFLAGDEVFTVETPMYDKEREVKSGVREKYSWVLSDDDISMFEKLLASENRKVKLDGGEKSFVYEFSDESVAAISEILDAYKKLTSS